MNKLRARSRSSKIRSAKAKSPPLATRIHQAGLTWSKQRFFITGAVMGVVTFVLFLMINAGLLAAAGAGFAAAFGLPFWILRFLKKRREAKFLAGFPDAVDIIVRGIKAGLPLLDCLRMITVDTAGAAEERIPRPSSRRKPSASRSATPAPSFMSEFRCRRRTSSASSFRSSSAPAAICRKRSAISPRFCASAKR